MTISKALTEREEGRKKKYAMMQERKALNRALKKIEIDEFATLTSAEHEAISNYRVTQEILDKRASFTLDSLVGKQVTMQVQVPEKPFSIASERQVGGSHYKTMGVQTWDVVDTWPLEQRIGYYRGNALKYLMRMGSKDQNSVEIAKGEHYVQKLLEVLKEQNGTE